jgi:acetyltransferase
MKVVSPDAIHKSDAGGVLLGIRGPEQAKEAFGTIRNSLRSYRKKARFMGVRVSAMAQNGLDMFIGAKQDPSFGPVVFFGMGGVFIELFRDVAMALCPTFHDEVAEKVLQLRSAAMLRGYRGTEPSDTEAFVDAVVRVSHLIQAFPQIEELDINPVRVFPKGQGVLALDSRMRIGMVKE